MEGKVSDRQVRRGPATCGRIGAAGEGWDGMNRTRAEATGLDWQVTEGRRGDQGQGMAGGDRKRSHRLRKARKVSAGVARTRSEP